MINLLVSFMRSLITIVIFTTIIYFRISSTITAFMIPKFIDTTTTTILQQQQQQHISRIRSSTPAWRILRSYNINNNHSNTIKNPAAIGTTASSSGIAAIQSSSNTTTTPESNNYNYYWNLDQLLSYATEEGIVLSISKVGPFIRAIARAEHNTTILLGYVEGFVRPKSVIPSLSLFSSSTSNVVLHLDKMEVFQSMVSRARQQQQQQSEQLSNDNNINNTNTNKFRNGGTILGIGLLLGYYCILDYVMNQQSSSSTSATTTTTARPPFIAEFLAIDDEYYQHERLVKYYTIAGFDRIKYVGDTPNDIPDRLIWGGCGTLLQQNCITLLCKWTKLMERSQRKRNNK